MLIRFRKPNYHIIHFSSGKQDNSEYIYWSGPLILLTSQGVVEAQSSYEVRAATIDPVVAKVDVTSGYSFQHVETLSDGYSQLLTESRKECGSEFKMASQSTCKPSGMCPENSILAARNSPSNTTNPTTAEPLDSGMKLYLKAIYIKLSQTITKSPVPKKKIAWTDCQMNTSNMSSLR